MFNISVTPSFKCLKEHLSNYNKTKLAIMTYIQYSNCTSNSYILKIALLLRLKSKEHLCPKLILI